MSTRDNRKAARAETLRRRQVRRVKYAATAPELVVTNR